MAQTHTPGKIVVGVNGSRSSLRALTWAHGQARLTHGELHTVISTWTVPVDHGWAPVPEGSDWHDLARDVLDQAIEETLGHTGNDRIHRQVVRGHPARALLDAAADADLLVVGSGSADAAGTALSSLCQDLVSRAPCPVVVVRGGPELIGPTGPSSSEPSAAVEHHAPSVRASR
jgi:nucleotide-binding universal stress UspA family protein